MCHSKGSWNDERDFDGHKAPIINEFMECLGRKRTTKLNIARVNHFNFYGEWVVNNIILASIFE